ncbi:E3 ubiquitin-protein ligase SH3RF2 isoform X2 [Protopterus annectens]|uniref:E3 ubiquitin-protein ligase SH3RF2 isoform X2 n=1 Tax=Protopterus annectens TaxID=7888 RepID=UPI001CF9C2DA|nr:E3 ubiquitin-protein ligase SH3RF2 isoform X2 [Protopterus annectens]
MEDLALLELLECPICFEKLDVTAKVLPCQHTFCKSCLQRIQTAGKELRCPECRTLVYGDIDDLPANLLLVRLLDGLRYGQNSMRSNSTHRHAAFPYQDSIRRARDLRSLHSTHRIAPNDRIPMEGIPCARVLYNYGGQMPGDLRLKAGDVVILHRQVDENWYQGELNGVIGIFPASFVQVIKQLPEQLPLCKALYNFDLQDRDENKDCLTFLKDDIITMIRRVDENWAEGRLGNKIGIFPICFVEPNSAARQLLEMNTGSLPYHSGSSSATSGASSSVKAPDSPIYRRMSSTVGKNLRRYPSNNALNMINRLSQPSLDQQPLEISAPVLISSSNPAVLVPCNDSRDMSTSSSAQITASSDITAVPGPTSSIMGFQNSQQQVATDMCAVLHPYTPRNPEELELQSGDVIRIYGKFQEGWLKGVSLVSGKIGIFPSNCVTPIFRTGSVRESRIPSPSSLRPARGFSSMTAPQERSLSNGVSLSTHGKPVAVATAVISTGSMKHSSSQSRTTGRIPVKQSSMMRRGSSLPRHIQPGIPVQVHNTVRRSLSAAGRSPPLQPAHPSVHEINSHPLAFATALRSSQPNHLMRPLGRSMESANTPGNSFLTLETKEYMMNNDPLSKPTPASPPSILVKPDTAKSNSEKPVKTVRFQDDSPPPSKKLDPQVSLNNQSLKQEQSSVGTVHREMKGPEGSLFLHSRSNSCPVPTENNRIWHRNTGSLDLSSSSIPTMLLQTSAANLRLTEATKRYKTGLAYPTYGEAEYNLKAADTLLLQRTRQDGWPHGTSDKTGKAVLFPYSFVECLE